MHFLICIVGIDCPFGWPMQFVDLVAEHATRTLRLPNELTTGWRRGYVLRETDRWVHRNLGLVPLSVAADRIGHTALRMAALLSHCDPAETPLDGSGRVAEVYPTAALKAWSLPFRGYKGAAKMQHLDLLVRDLRKAAPWLQLGGFETLMRESDDAFDAVICALVARAVARGITWRPENVELARTEGWIHVPRGTIDDLR